MSRKSFGKLMFFFFFFDGTAVQWGPSPPQWTPSSQLRSLTSPSNLQLCICKYPSVHNSTNPLPVLWSIPLSLFRAHSLGFLPVFFLIPWRVVGLSPNPQPGGSVHRIYNLRGRVAHLYLQAPGTHFDRLLRHAWAAVGSTGSWRGSWGLDGVGSG